MTNADDNSPECQEVLRSMYEFLDKELKAGRRDHVQQHLDECMPCLEAFEFEAELKVVIAKRCCDDVPDELYAKVKMQLKAEIDKTLPGGGIPSA